MHYNANKTAIKIKELYFSYGKKQILENINLKINKGDFIALIGHNGAGKTTLVKLMLGILKPTKGTIEYCTKNIGYVQQLKPENKYLPINVYELVALPLLKDKTLLAKDKEIDKRIEKALRTIGLADKKYELLNNLSGGQQQRVYLARALVNNPDIIILDEPTNNLDILSQKQFYKILAKLNKQGKTIILVTHDIGLILNVVQRIAVINKKIVYEGNAKQMDVKRIWKVLEEV